MRLGQEIQALPRRPRERLIIIHVVAAAVIDAGGRVLIAQRPAGKPLAGGWEFPGGKLEPGERRVEGLARELREEIGIDIGQPRPLLRLRHRYPHGTVLLDVWVVSRYAGTARGMDGQALRWLGPDELAAVELLPADRPIVAALRLPAVLDAKRTAAYEAAALADFIAAAERRRQRPEPCAGAGGLLGAVCASAREAAAGAQAGADFIALGEVLAESELAALCERLDVPVFARGLPIERAWELGASGINAIV